MLWYDANGQIVAEADAVSPSAGLTGIDAQAPGPDLTAYRVVDGAIVAKTVTVLTATPPSVVHGAPVALSVASGEAVTFSVNGPAEPSTETVQPVSGVCAFTYTPPAPGTYTAQAVGLTTYSNTVTITAT